MIGDEAAGGVLHQYVDPVVCGIGDTGRQAEQSNEQCDPHQ
jgi:hypothetical protein